MSIENFHGAYTAVCDCCGDILPTESDFYEAVNAKKDAGWKSRKVDGEWNDICPDCQNLE